MNINNCEEYKFTRKKFKRCKFSEFHDIEYSDSGLPSSDIV